MRKIADSKGHLCGLKAAIETGYELMAAVSSSLRRGATICMLPTTAPGATGILLSCPQHEECCLSPCACYPSPTVSGCMPQGLCHRQFVAQDPVLHCCALQVILSCCLGSSEAPVKPHHHCRLSPHARTQDCHATQHNAGIGSAGHARLGLSWMFSGFKTKQHQC